MMKQISKRFFSLGAVAAGLIILLGVLLPGLASAAEPAYQIPVYTPTPLPDGRIIYIVQPNDSLLSISLISGVPVEELRGLNNLTNDIIFEGQELLLGLGGPAEMTPTPGPSPTPTEALPTPTPRPGSGNLCVLLFNDVNGDAIRQEDETTIPDGAISVNNRAATVSLTANTRAGLEPECFNELPEGNYTVSVAAPEGYNPTTISNYAFELRAGDETYIDFGAQANSQTAAAAPAPSDGGRSPVLGILGGLLLVAGIALAVVAGRYLKR